MIIKKSNSLYMDLEIKKYYYNTKKIYAINPIFNINFNKIIFNANCEYENKIFYATLNKNELRHIDSDYLYFDVAILLMQKLNHQIHQYNLLKTIT